MKRAPIRKSLKKNPPNRSKFDAARPIILRALKKCATIQTACDIANVGMRTYFDWLDRADAEPGSKYARFAEECRRAIASAEMTLLGIVVKAAKEGNWQAGMTALERRFPQKYSRRYLPAEAPAPVEPPEPKPVEPAAEDIGNKALSLPIPQEVQ